jgi:hypothetical protein
VCNSPYLLFIRFSGIGGSKASRPARGRSCRRAWPSRGEGVVRARAVSELTERVTFFFFNHEPRAFHYSVSSSNVFSSSTAYEKMMKPSHSFSNLSTQTRNTSDVKRRTEGTVLDSNQRSAAVQAAKKRRLQASVIDTLVLWTPHKVCGVSAAKGRTELDRATSIIYLAVCAVGERDQPAQDA